MDTKRAIQNYLESQINSAKQERKRLHEKMQSLCFVDCSNLFNDVFDLNLKIETYEEVLSFINTL